MELTQEQKELIDNKRKQALEKLQKKRKIPRTSEHSSSITIPSSSPHQPVTEPTTTDGTSPSAFAAPPDKSKPTLSKSKIKYYDYNLTNMVDSKGGFLVEDAERINSIIGEKEKDGPSAPKFDPRKLVKQLGVSIILI
jgi:DNA-repair protein complementing XP-A cells